MKINILKFSFLSFIAIMLFSNNAYAFDTSVIDWAIGELCGHINGHLGGLLVTVAGFGAIVAGAFGSYRVAYSAIITAVGAFTISSIMSLYFPDAAQICKTKGSGIDPGGGGLGGNTPIRTANSQQIKFNPNIDNENSNLSDEKNKKIDPFSSFD